MRLPWLVVCALATACGGRLAPVDGGGLSGDGAPVGDAGDESVFADASDAADASDTTEPCSYDASDERLCAPPPDDLLYPTPPVVSVAAGSYGSATFVASGPWSTDPNMYMWVTGYTLQLDTYPQVESYGTPQTVTFLVPQAYAGQSFTMFVAGHAGNIERTTQVTVNVTNCAPLPASTVCAGYQCGFEDDNCGGLVSCGNCSAPTPYCFLRQCQATMPTYCPYGDGLGPFGACVPCGESMTCRLCTGLCVGIQDVCICQTGG